YAFKLCEEGEKVEEVFNIPYTEQAVKEVTVLGTTTSVVFKQTEEGIQVRVPSELIEEGAIAVGFKLEV
ncbi:MAG: hypothetical protein E6370_13425, partial [Clostridiales bacterium]|nr:hypothetical protein [Clostridiales bacterium]MDU6975307.1 hypothetical protein [Clostridiales bacterium]